MWLTRKNVVDERKRSERNEVKLNCGLETEGIDSRGCVA